MYSTDRWPAELALYQHGQNPGKPHSGAKVCWQDVGGVIGVAKAESFRATELLTYLLTSVLHLLTA